MQGLVVRRLAITLLWLVIVIAYASIHVFWRDEVRALDFARSGNSYFEMMGVTRGDGHPFGWYIILRTLDLLIGRSALPVAAFAIGAAAMLLWIWKAPFSSWLILLFCLTRMASYEYVVMARNYGISMLLMFAFAYVYREGRHWRWRESILVFLLAVLMQTNVHSVGLAWMFFSYWRLDDYRRQAGRAVWRLAVDWRTVFLAAATLLAFLSVWPSFNDAAKMDAAVNAKLLFHAIFVHNSPLFDAGTWGLSVIPDGLSLIAILLISLIFVESRLALSVYWGASLIFSIFFHLVSFPSFRHGCLFLAFVLALGWTTQSPADGAKAGGRSELARRVGIAALAGVFLLQIADNVALAMQLRTVPESQVERFANFIRHDPKFGQAILLADPESVLGAMPYYTDNPVYQVRAQRFGSLMAFTEKYGRGLPLDRITDTALRLHKEHARPVILLMGAPPRCGTAGSYPTGYRLFTYYSAGASTRFCKVFTPVADFRGSVSDESYTAYRISDGK